MNLDRYKSLKVKIRDKSFETNFNSLDKGLYALSFLGNAGAIFFAFFLLNPALQKTITEHVSNSIVFQIVGMILAVVILTGVEYIKRNVFRIFVDEYIQSTYNFFKGGVFALAMFSLLIFGASFYFSVTGGIKFSKLADQKNELIVANNKSLYDSLAKESEKSKMPINDEIANLRESNKTLRDKRDQTPLNYRSARAEYTRLIEDNEAQLLKKQNELGLVDKALQVKIASLKNQEKQQIEENKDSDFGSIFLFLIISTGSELLIIAGIYFRELYEHRSFYETENRLEPILKKRERYDQLLKIIYKNGEVRADDQVLSLSKLSQIMASKSSQFPPKMLNEFYLETTNLSIFKVMSKKRYAMVSYDDAKKILESLES